jgi:hypothetical protein
MTMEAANVPVTEGAPVYLHHDQQGSTRMMTHHTGEIAATYTYGAHGSLTGSTGTGKTSIAVHQLNVLSGAASTATGVLTSEKFEPAHHSSCGCE